jgi:hypothetical protein
MAQTASQAAVCAKGLRNMTAGLAATAKEDFQRCFQQRYCHLSKYVRAEWQYFEGCRIKFSDPSLLLCWTYWYR